MSEQEEDEWEKESEVDPIEVVNMTEVRVKQAIDALHKFGIIAVPSQGELLCQMKLEGVDIQAIFIYSFNSTLDGGLQEHFRTSVIEELEKNNKGMYVVEGSIIKLTPNLSE